MRIYFAGSIRGGPADRDFYTLLVKKLQQYGVVLTEHVPTTGANETQLSDREIHDRDLAWLESCDVLVAEVTAPSHGVGYEIGRAVEMDKRIICLREKGKGRISAMIGGCNAIEVIEYDRTTIDTLLEQCLKDTSVQSK